MSKSPRIRYRDWLDRQRGGPGTGSPAPEPEPEAVAPSRGVAASAEADVPSAHPAPASPPPASAADSTVEAPPAGAAVEPDHAETDATEHLVFRLGRELFALPLAVVEEAVELEGVQRVPDMRAAMLGVIPVRGTLVPLYAPGPAIGTEGGAARAALVFATPHGPLAMAVDDVDDVLSLPSGSLLRAPLEFGDTVMVGVARRDGELIGVLDPDALIAACRGDRAVETA